MMLIAYLMVAVIPAALSLTCSCTLQRHSLQAHHSHCCCASQEDHLHDRNHLHMDEACSCLHDHSTEIDLYTFSEGDSERSPLRIAVVQLLPDQAAEGAFERLDGQTELLFADLPAPHWERIYLLRAPFRAPPVVA